MAALGFRKRRGDLLTHCRISAAGNRLSSLRPHFFQHLAGARALEAFAQWAVWIDFLVADKAVIPVADRVQSTTAPLDALARKNHAQRHAEHDDHQKTKRKKESFHARYP